MDGMTFIQGECWYGVLMPRADLIFGVRYRSRSTNGTKKQKVPVATLLGHYHYMLDIASTCQNNQMSHFCFRDTALQHFLSFTCQIKPQIWAYYKALQGRVFQQTESSLQCHRRVWSIDNILKGLEV